ncbi:gasdermin [Autumnicola psychrophila]|uniref:Gasdermin bGSDM n=1 Tax=Autumnicola psychrophila TaxID=3075592 RepID=A0ABU3DTH9_9FLAO|nr:hypothetical protein [Zunongwangia sp. F225]MDT0687019.1 hypothetical protein [Zunongwangia sp. F225]
MSKVLKNALSQYGYNLVALPKEGIVPLLLLYKNKKDVSSSGNNLDKLFAIADSPPPIVSENNTTLSLQQNSTVSFDGKAGINILDWLLHKLKMGKLSGEFNMNHINSLEISYQNVLEDHVSLLELDNFISGSEPEVEQFNTFKEKLKDSELYVINSLLKSNSFSISALNGNGQKVDLEATIKGIVDADVNIERSKKDHVVLEHKNATPIVFAFKAQRIIYDHKKWWQFFKKGDAKFRIKDEQDVVLKGDSDFPTQSLKKNNELINI